MTASYLQLILHSTDIIGMGRVYYLLRGYFSYVYFSGKQNKNLSGGFPGFISLVSLEKLKLMCRRSYDEIRGK